jgi:hypothetical protein
VLQRSGLAHKSLAAGRRIWLRACLADGWRQGGERGFYGDCTFPHRLTIADADEVFHVTAEMRLYSPQTHLSTAPVFKPATTNHPGALEVTVNASRVVGLVTLVTVENAWHRDLPWSTRDGVPTAEWQVHLPAGSQAGPWENTEWSCE